MDVNFDVKKQQIAVLKRTRELLESGWTRHTLARTKRGTVIWWANPKAARYCLNGALLRASKDLNMDGLVYCRRVLDATLATVLLPPHRNDLSLEEFNDSKRTSKKDVLALVDLTIQSLNQT
jgi:hypothetical protein